MKKNIKNVAQNTFEEFNLEKGFFVL
ncbi:MAG: hypothetical protein ACI8RP_001733, partial [Urechidicola sp.]